MTATKTTRRTPAAAPRDPADDVAQAEAEATEAAALVDALEERVRAGDDAVTAAELDDAHRLSRFARLRREAAERKATVARTAMVADARKTRAEEIKAAARSGALDVEPLAAAYATMRDAVTAFVSAANTYNQAWQQARDGIEGYPFREEEGGPAMADLGVRVDSTFSGRPRVIADGIARFPLRTSEHLARVVVDAESSISPRHGQLLRPVAEGMARHATMYQPDLAEAGEADGGAA
ncbi:hypothetical protein [Actinomadura rugatobispora]|uniref:DUF222 domain-containing protein n=1 Tax=Actinomadura rugatobispora TaxID=1994 RepID=A0ABW1A0D4_9ACTN|nr:hypothetical protein GCM10010200_029050 [Actinomadura rugatobispora]